MKEIRGTEAVRYANMNGLDFSIDEAFLVEAERQIRGGSATIEDIDSLLQRQLGEPYDPARIIDGSSIYKFLLDRYGDQWIYMPLEGNHPLDEEQAVLGLYQRLLTAKMPRGGGDISDLATEDPPTLVDTGFPEDSHLDLLFHAALRLVEKGMLLAVPDSLPVPDDEEPNYGNTYFLLPFDYQVSLLGLLCEECRDSLNASTLNLHQECAQRLSKRLKASVEGTSTTDEETPS